MLRKINSNNSNYKFLNLNDEEFFIVFNKEWSNKNSFRKYRGFAVQTEKGENNTYFPTKKPSKYEEVNIVNGKEVVKQLPWEFCYKNIDDAFRSAKDYKQVMAGLTHYRRDAMVCDCDHDFTSRTQDKFNSFCDKYNIPRPNYFVINPLTNHYQVVWILEDGYEGKYSITGPEFPERMHILRHEINLLLDGDQNFTGGFMKNPYYEGLHTIVNSKVFVNRHKLEMSFERAFIDENNGISYKEYKKLQKQLKNKENTVKSEKKDIVIKLSKKESRGRSRHMESFENSRTDAFKYMRENNGSLTKEFVEKRVRYWQQVVVDELFDPERSTIEDDNTINSIVNSVYDYCVANFKPMGTGKFNANHEYGTEVQIIRSACRFFVINYYYEQGKKTAEIAKILNLTSAGVRKNYREHIDDKEDFFELVKTYYGQHMCLNDDTSTRFCEIIKEMFDLIGYEFTTVEEIVANREDYISNEEFMDKVFEIYSNWCLVRHPKGYIEYDRCYRFKPRIKVA